MKNDNSLLLTVEKDITFVGKGCILATRRPPRSLERLWSALHSQKRKLLYRFETLKSRDFVFRKLEQPPKVRAYMEYKSVQFFLRDIERLEMSVDEEVILEKFFERPIEDENIVLSLRKMRYEKPKFIEEFNIVTVLKLRQTLRRVLFQERWNTRFCREIKEKIRGPIYRYEPNEGEG
jgi:hypothetical protein